MMMFILSTVSVNYLFIWHDLSDEGRAPGQAGDVVTFDIEDSPGKPGSLRAREGEREGERARG